MKVAFIFWRYSPLLLLAGAWQAATESQLVSPYLLPTLSSVFASLITMINDDLAYQTEISLLRGAAGFGAAVGVGVAAGVLMAWYRPVRQVMNPVIQLLYPLPQSALIPIVIIWLGLGAISKISLIFLGLLLPIVVSTFNAARGVDHLLVWSARSAGAREPSLLWEIVLPAASPEIINGIRVALALMFILMVAGELIFANDGIGYLISVHGENGDYAGMFAGVLAISLVGLVADRLFVLATRRVMLWRT